MTKRLRLPGHSDVSRPLLKTDDGQLLSEAELSEWAEQSTIATHRDSDRSHFGELMFWILVACLLIARFFVIDPAKLRPQSSGDGLSIFLTNN